MLGKRRTHRYFGLLDGHSKELIQLLGALFISLLLFLPAPAHDKILLIFSLRVASTLIVLEDLVVQHSQQRWQGACAACYMPQNCRDMSCLAAVHKFEKAVPDLRLQLCQDQASSAHCTETSSSMHDNTVWSPV